MRPLPQDHGGRFTTQLDSTITSHLQRTERFTLTTHLKRLEVVQKGNKHWMLRQRDSYIYLYYIDMIDVTYCIYCVYTYCLCRIPPHKSTNYWVCWVLANLGSHPRLRTPLDDVSTWVVIRTGVIGSHYELYKWKITITSVNNITDKWLLKLIREITLSKGFSITMIFLLKTLLCSLWKNGIQFQIQVCTSTSQHPFLNPEVHSDHLHQHPQKSWSHHPMQLALWLRSFESPPETQVCLRSSPQKSMVRFVGLGDGFQPFRIFLVFRVEF